MTLARFVIGAAVLLLGVVFTTYGLVFLAQDVADLIRYPDPQSPDLVVSGFLAAFGAMIVIAGGCTLRGSRASNGGR